MWCNYLNESHCALCVLTEELFYQHKMHETSPEPIKLEWRYKSEMGFSLCPEHGFSTKSALGRCSAVCSVPLLPHQVCMCALRRSCNSLKIVQSKFSFPDADSGARPAANCCSRHTITSGERERRRNVEQMEKMAGKHGSPRRVALLRVSELRRMKRRWKCWKQYINITQGLIFNIPIHVESTWEPINTIGARSCGWSHRPLGCGTWLNKGSDVLLRCHSIW